MTKRHKLTILTAITVLLLSHQAALQAATSGDYQYTDNLNGTCTITDYTGSDPNVTIPETLASLTVTSIGYLAFYNNTSLTYITIPDAVTSIGDMAFLGCSGLTSVTIGNSVTSIGDSTFKDCDALTSVIIGSGVTSIGDWAFGYCTGLTSILIPDSVTSIGNYAFKDCSALQSIIIPDSVANIGYGVFQGCSDMTSVTMPQGLASIGNYAFKDCSALSSITIPDSVTSIGIYAFESCTSLANVIISENVVSIGKYAFAECSALTSINIPDGVSSIEDSTFRDCSSLASISIPSTVYSIETFSFQNCSGLTAITVDENNPAYSSIDGVLFDKNKSTLIHYPASKVGDYIVPNTVISIQDRSFQHCSFLTNLYISESVTSIGGWVFSNSTSLASITVDENNTVYSSIDGVLLDKNQSTLIKYPNAKAGDYEVPDSVTSIGWSAFYDCNSLTSVSIGSSVNSIEQYAIGSCSNLTEITVDTSNNYFSSIDGVLFSKGKTKIIQYPGGKAGSYAVPDSVTSLGSNAFNGCYSLTDIILPESVTLIGFRAFESCYNLTSIIIPDTVVEIEYRTFLYCTGLTRVTIGKGTTSIGFSAFSNCNSLTSIFFKGDAPDLGSNVFTGVGAIAYYPPGTTGWADTYGGLPTEPWPLLPSDVYIDGEVNYADFAVFASAWQTSLGQPGYDPACDIVADDVIDINDLLVLADNWLGFITIADFTTDGRTNFQDFGVLSQNWLQDKPDLDIAPIGAPDGIIDIEELLILANYWLY